MIGHLLIKHREISKLPVSETSAKLENISSLLDHIASFLNSSFASSLIGATAGACLGAYAATRFAEKSQREALKLQDLRKINSGVALAGAIANDSINFKKQLTLGLIENYLKDRINYQNTIAEIEAGNPIPRIEIQLCLISLTFFKHEADELRSLIINVISPEANIIMATMLMWQSLHSLERAINHREAEILSIKKLLNKPKDENIFNIYFGIEGRSGNTERGYSDSMEIISDMLDRSIFFSKYIAEKLSERGCTLSSQLGKKDYPATTWDFSDAVNQKLIPDKSNFPDWE